MRGRIEIPFIKMHGIGNDYIYIDALKGEMPEYLKEKNLPDLSRKISDRHFGVGSDGLILILPSTIADFRMRIFNSDGSEAKMCGNGIRCVGKYVYDLGFTTKKILNIETESGIKKLELKVGDKGVESVIVEMGSPFFERNQIPVKGNGDRMVDQPLESEGEIFKVTGVSMGNPHGVIYVENIDEIELSKYGPHLEYNEVWPDRANIEFVEVLNPNEIKVRVWERGSGETMACGTGACASAVISCMKGFTRNSITVHLRGGDLTVFYNDKDNTVRMEGGAKFIGKGVYWKEER